MFFVFGSRFPVASLRSLSLPRRRYEAILFFRSRTTTPRSMNCSDSELLREILSIIRQNQVPPKFSTRRYSSEILGLSQAISLRSEHHSAFSTTNIQH
jgi:hypothetical protein